MHINVRDFLAESTGYSQAFKISGERPEFENVKLTSDIEGEATIARLDENLLVRGHAATSIELECHRCLRTFSRPVNVSFQQTFAQDPLDDDMPVVDNEIDLAPLIEQEIILGLPIKILHAEDCAGLPGIADRYMKEDASTRLENQPRITKGTKRGST